VGSIGHEQTAALFYGDPSLFALNFDFLGNPGEHVRTDVESWAQGISQAQLEVEAAEEPATHESLGWTFDRSGHHQTFLEDQ
jgi:hypothetical protein